ncbi:Acyl dehydratase [Halovenus aranensis]|jgi:acyl dehydratase|uniref:Acyl dehydratase n=1 Tax=Halovenus aranensis TaxID=890420 RepID=A0A1G8Y881_9EURY|nr:MaoC/PaaZ C-terminal domain-containing protein [Halovenus aranensis]SDJ98415.1 Acyl dehydratase [Halovenus aranensis]
MAYSYEPHHWEDFEVGQTFETVGRTVTESDFTLHSMFTGDWTELHSNAEYAEDGPFGARVAHGPMTFTLATGFVYRSGIVERTVYAFLGMNYMDVNEPVFMDDTISMEMEVTDKKEIDSVEDADMVTIDTVVTNQDDVAVFEGDMKFLIYNRDAKE